MPRRLWQMNTHTQLEKPSSSSVWGGAQAPQTICQSFIIVIIIIAVRRFQGGKKYKKMNPAGGPPQLATLCCCNHLFLVSFLFRGEMQFDFPLGWLVSHSEARGRITEADRIKSTLQSKASNNTHTRSVRGLTHPAHPSTLASTVFKIEKIKV